MTPYEPLNDIGHSKSYDQRISAYHPHDVGYNSNAGLRISRQISDQEDRDHNFRAAPALILNADYQPLSYFPLSTLSWQDAIKAVFLDRVHIVAEYEDFEICSSQACFKLPSVLALKEYVKPRQFPAFTRFNVFLRDKFTCQYCDTQFKASELTFDHVIPRALGGRTSWENIVASCRKCNTQKGHKLPKQCGMVPLNTPAQPTIYELQENGRSFPPNFLHEDWHDFLYWDSELEE
ncbi:MAG: HNH endonuclease [Rickettsiales bacterium]|nr:HNH endonuclease [Rickettsiales bacterium]